MGPVKREPVLCKRVTLPGNTFYSVLPVCQFVDSSTFACLKLQTESPTNTELNQSANSTLESARHNELFLEIGA